MSKAEFIKVKYRLTEQVAREGGMTVGIAMQRVARELAAVEAKSREAIGVTIGVLEDLCQEKSVSMDDIYDLSTAVIDVAGLFDEKLLCQAAYSLCELTDKLRNSDRTDWTSITIHANAMRLLHAGEEKNQEKLHALVDGLWAITERVKEPPPAA